MSHTVLRINSPMLVGIEGRWVSAAVHVTPPHSRQFSTDDAAVHRALHAAGFGDDRRFVANVGLDAARRGSSANLAIALTLLAAEGRVPRYALENVLPLGLLTDDGHIKPVHGTYAILRTLPLGGLRTILVPRAAAVHASWVAGLTVLTADSLAGAVRVLCSPAPTTVTPPISVSIPRTPIEALRESWPITQTTAHALDVAAAVGHHVLLIGPEGSATTGSHDGSWTCCLRQPSRKPSPSRRTTPRQHSRSTHNIYGAPGDGASIINLRQRTRWRRRAVLAW